MQHPLVTTDRPIAIYTNVQPEYIREAIAINHLSISRCRSGRAILIRNFLPIEEVRDVMILSFPSDVLHFTEISPDFEVEFLVITDNIANEAFSSLEGISRETLQGMRSIQSPSLALLTDAAFTQVKLAMELNDTKALHDITVLQLRSILIAFRAECYQRGITIGQWKNRSDELFARFLYKLSQRYHEERSASYYASQLCITNKYLTNICLAHSGKPAKQLIDEYVIMQLQLALLESDESVARLAIRFHFSSPAFLCDYFKRHVGQAPLAYRASKATPPPTQEN